MVQSLTQLLKNTSFPKQPVSSTQGTQTQTQTSITQSYLLSKNTNIEDASSNHPCSKDDSVNSQKVDLREDISGSLIKSTQEKPQKPFELDSHRISEIKSKNSFMCFTGISMNPLLHDDIEMIQEVSRDNSELEPTLIINSNKKTDRKKSLLTPEQIPEESSPSQGNSAISKDNQRISTPRICCT